MARKTFISYKYSEARDLRDRIIWALGDDATFYQGETSDSPDLTDTTTENMKRHLTDMMYNTSVTIVIISSPVKEENKEYNNYYNPNPTPSTSKTIITTASIISRISVHV